MIAFWRKEVLETTKQSNGKLLVFIQGRNMSISSLKKNSNSGNFHQIE